jgi:hypothetical protein
MRETSYIRDILHSRADHSPRNPEEETTMKRGSVLATVLVAIFLVLQTGHAQDQVGAPKNLTPQIVKKVVNLVKEGKRYSLTRTLEIGIPYFT